MKKLFNPVVFFTIINASILLLWALIPTSFYNYMANGIQKYYSISALAMYITIFLFVIICIHLFIRLTEKKVPKNSEKMIISKKMIYVINIVVFVRMYFYLVEINNHSNGNLIQYMVTFDANSIGSIITLNSIRTPYIFNLIYIVFILLGINKYFNNIKNGISIYVVSLIPAVFRAIYFGERNSIIYLVLIQVLLSLNGTKKAKIPKFKIALSVLVMVTFFIAVESVRSFKVFEETGIATNSIIWGISTLANYLVLPFNYLLYTVDNISVTTFPAQSLSIIYGPLSNFDVVRTQSELYYEVRHIILSSVNGSQAFNNLSFIAEVFIEFNFFLFIYIFALSFLIAITYNLFRRRHALGLLTYPMFLIGIFESYRINFFMNPIFITSIIYLIFIYIITRIRFINTRRKGVV